MKYVSLKNGLTLIIARGISDAMEVATKVVAAVVVLKLMGVL